MNIYSKNEELLFVGSKKQLAKELLRYTKLRIHYTSLRTAAWGVIDNWEQGDLAGAVRKLSNALTEV